MYYNKSFLCKFHVLKLNEHIMNIPEQVKTEAKEFIKQYGESFKYLGNIEGQEAYLFLFPEEITIGFPFLYLLKNGEVIEVSGPMVFDFIDYYTLNS